MNSRKKHTELEVRLLAKKLSKEDIRKYSKFETLATTLCDQQEALDEAQRRYDEQVQLSSAQIAQLTRSHEARLEHEVRQAKAQVDMAADRVQASEAQAQLRLQEQTQRADMLISELRRALTETTDQAIANTRAAAEVEVLLRKELLEAKHRIAEEPAWSVFVEKHNDKEEIQELEHRRRAAVTAQPSGRRNRGLEDEANRVELRVSANNPLSDSAAATSHLATPHGADNARSSARLDIDPRNFLASVYWPIGASFCAPIGHLFVTPGQVFVPRSWHLFVPRAGHLFVTPGQVFVTRAGH